jgi:uncharacterized membrane protein YphA (DoxX/SURF4 family)
MNVTLSAIQIVLALVFAVAGGTKLWRSRLALADRMPWVEDMSDVQVKGIGMLEVAAAVGLVAPPLLHVATFLTPLAAVGVILLMLGAAATNLRIGERQILPVNALLMVLAAFVAVARFGPYHF